MEILKGAVVGDFRRVADIALFNQYFTIGDVIFSMGLVEKFLDAGYRCVYPTKDIFLEGLRYAYPLVEFVDYNKPSEDFPMGFKSLLGVQKDEVYIIGNNSVRVIPISFSMEAMGTTYDHVMRAKYDMYGLDYRDWQRPYVRNEVKELALRDLVVGVGGSYMVLNENCGVGFRRIRYNGGLRVIRMGSVQGYSMFDWSLVLEGSEEIHTVSTGLFYVLKILGLMERTRLYSRPNELGLENIRDLL